MNVVPKNQGRIFSGMRPTGRLHIGHLSVLQNWVRLQEQYECVFGIVDWHALTTSYEESGKFQELIRQIALDWLGAGLDPEKSIIMVQSQVKEHAELHLLFSMFTPLSWLERVPTYKDQIQQLGMQGKDISTYGFLGYPLLMAADISLYKADAVPVGEDQIPHIELCREVGRRFNFLYGTKIFPEPKALLSEIPLLPGVDGRKMSKSYNNDISLSATPEEIREKVNMMITDPARVRKSDPGHPEVCVVFTYQKLYNRGRCEELAEACRQGAIGCVACKKELAQVLDGVLSPIRERRRQYEAQPGAVEAILAEGNRRAQKLAARTMEEVRQAMGV